MSDRSRLCPLRPPALATTILIAVGLVLIVSCQQGYSGPVQSVTIGVPPNEQSGLIFIAEDQGFFAQNGLKATVKVYDTALAALNGMKSGEVDVSQTAAFPIITEAFKKENIAIIASIDRFQNMFLVARKDRGIRTVGDLKGRKIGAARGTATEFYLGRFLTVNGIGPRDASMVYMPFAQSADALAGGAVDAFQVQNRDLPGIKKRLGDNLVVWPSQSNQAAYEVIAGKKDWIAGHPETVKRILSSLDQAEEYRIRYPGMALAIVQRKLGYDDEYMATIAPQHTYSLSLEQSLILAMEDQARWMISNGRTAEKELPNFLDYISEGALKAVKPGAVNIIR